MKNASMKNIRGVFFMTLTYCLCVSESLNPIKENAFSFYC